MNLRARLWPAYQQYLKRSTLPILVGPFRGEVGFESLYWIPFLRRFAKKHRIDQARLVPITRGGAAAWYGMPTGIELYGMRTPQQVRVENRLQHQKNKMLKQIAWTPFDRSVIADAAKTLGVTRYQTLHPSWMYARLGPFFEGQMSLAALEQDARYDPLTIPAVPDGVPLPERFVAVRFYIRHTFPMAPMLVSFATESIKQIAMHTPVVLLHSGIHADDHYDLPVKGIPNVVALPDLMPMLPETNLAVQSAVLARALGFVGTYGGFSQLALRMGKPSVSYYHEWGGTMMAHKHLADAIALRQGIPCMVHKIGELALLQHVMPAISAG